MLSWQAFHERLPRPARFVEASKPNSCLVKRCIRYAKRSSQNFSQTINEEITMSISLIELQRRLRHNASRMVGCDPILPTHFLGIAQKGGTSSIICKRHPTFIYSQQRTTLFHHTLWTRQGLVWTRIRRCGSWTDPRRNHPYYLFHPRFQNGFIAIARACCWSPYFVISRSCALTIFPCIPPRIRNTVIGGRCSCRTRTHGKRRSLQPSETQLWSRNAMKSNWKIRRILPSNQILYYQRGPVSQHPTMLD